MSNTDFDEIATWCAVVVGAAFAAVLLCAMAWFLVTKLLEQGDKRECRASGRIVLVDKGRDDWQCAAQKAERP